MKIEYQCSNCAKRETTSAMAGIPHGMYAMNYRVVGDALYCPDCVNTWNERNGKPFDDQYKEPFQMFRKWWNRTVAEQAKRERKTVKQYHMTARGDCVDDGVVMALEEQG